MFTGIIREVGVLRRVSVTGAGATLEVEAPASRPHLVRGGSIAVDGVCLTVTSLSGNRFTADVVPETLTRTRLGGAKAGNRLNLELPLKLDQFLDGHLVQGHVDGLGTVLEIRDEGTQRSIRIGVEHSLAPFLAEKGSVAINGVSLTVTTVTEDSFGVALIPTTLNETNLNELRAGSQVNLEVDLLARYVARLAATGGLTAAGGVSAPGSVAVAEGPGAAGAQTPGPTRDRKQDPGLTRDRMKEMGY